MSQEARRITAIVNKGVGSGSRLVEESSGGPVSSVHLCSGRSSALQERTGLLGVFLPGMAMADDPVDVVSFVIDPGSEDSALQMIASTFGLDRPGRGSVYSEEVTIHSAHDRCAASTVAGPGGAPVRRTTDLMGICCIVQRGQAERVERVVLDAGAGVPAVTYGVGTGLRDKLGLLRIAIPAEKEVITLVTSAYEAESVMDMMIDAGKLDLPGRGFIYLYPVKCGVVNMKVSRGACRTAASVEQMIVAIDELKGGSRWRQRDHADLRSQSGSRKYLRDLADVTLACDEGRGDDLVKAAMAAGAAGATIGKARRLSLAASPEAALSPAREVCTMIVGEPQIEPIVAAIRAAGGFGDDAHGQIQIRRVPRACTYLG